MNRITQFFALFAVSAFALSFMACEVEQTKEAEMPEVKVEGGQAPEFDVETPEVAVEEKEIDIPDTITVPDVDVTMPDEKTQETEEAAETPAVPEATPPVE